MARAAAPGEPTVPGSSPDALIGNRAFVDYTGTYGDPTSVLTLHAVDLYGAEGTQVAYVEQGTLTYRVVEGRVRVKSTFARGAMFLSSKGVFPCEDDQEGLVRRRSHQGGDRQREPRQDDAEGEP